MLLRRKKKNLVVNRSLSALLPSTLCSTTQQAHEQRMLAHGWVLAENLERTWDLLGSPPLVDDWSVVAGFQLQERELFNLQALLEH